MGKRIVALLAVMSVILLSGPVWSVSSAASTPVSESNCGVTWGSLVKRSGPPNSPEAPLTDVRSGRHDCYDRMVLDLDGPTAGYRVRYVDEVHTVASGEVIPLRAAGAALEIVLKAPADDGAGNPTYDGVSPRRLPRVDLRGYRTFRVAKYGGSFEGRTIIALGIRARLPFRVLELDGRIVIDVAHQW